MAAQVTPRGELLLDVALAVGMGQITARGIEEPPGNAGAVAITGGAGLCQSAGGEIRFRGKSQATALRQVVAER